MSANDNSLQFCLKRLRCCLTTKHSGSIVFLLFFLMVSLSVCIPAVAWSDGEHDHSQEIISDDLAWLAYSASAAAYLPLDHEDAGPRYLKDGKIQENWSSIRVNVPGRCAYGREKSGELCYVPCKEGFYGVGPVCWKPCQEGYNDDGALCRRDRTYAKKSYGRGAGAPLGCRQGEERNGLLCYPKCSKGFYGVGPVCWEACPGGFRDHGASCYKSITNWFFKKSRGRGAGRKLTNNCDKGLEKDGLLCYPKCKESYRGVGPVCWQDCESSFTDTGAFCQDKVKVYAKSSYGRGAGKPIIISAYESVYDKDSNPTGGWTGKSYANEQEYIVLRNEEQAITIFAFRGTEPTSTLDWLRDLDFTPNEVTINDRKVWVHSGFHRRFRNVSDDIEKELKATPENHKIIITGHSLGAAVAAVAAPYFHQWGYPSDAVILFANPLVADKRFKAMFEEVLGCDSTMRVVVDQDPVPKAPDIWGYTQFCENNAYRYKYKNSNLLKVHDLYIAYYEAMKGKFGPQPSLKASEEDNPNSWLQP